jgi:hypothetical protein
VGPEAAAEIKGLLLECGRPVKDEDWEDDWRDYDWCHSLSGCEGWQETEQSEVVQIPYEDGVLFTVTHCRCDCRVFPLVTIGLEGMITN